MDWLSLKASSALAIACCIGCLCQGALLLSMVNEELFTNVDIWHLFIVDFALLFPVLFLNTLFYEFLPVTIEPDNSESQKEAINEEGYESNNKNAVTLGALITCFLLVILLLLRYYFNTSVSAILLISFLYEIGVCIMGAFIRFKNKK